jgi:hypothetical protein
MWQIFPIAMNDTVLWHTEIRDQNEAGDQSCKSSLVVRSIIASLIRAAPHATDTTATTATATTATATTATATTATATTAAIQFHLCHCIDKLIHVRLLFNVLNFLFQTEAILSVLMN